MRVMFEKDLQTSDVVKVLNAWNTISSQQCSTECQVLWVELHGTVCGRIC